MKKYLLFFTVLFTSAIAFGQDNSSRTVDAQDTVVFDLFQATEAPGYVEFPVYFLSDDTVNAIDFNLKYNTGSFTFYSIINLTSYLQITYHEQIDTTTTHDTTVYFTSYSLQRITNDTPLVKIRFTNLTGGQFCIADINSTNALLNGDACSVKIANCSPNGIAEADLNKNITNIYPNPVSENTELEFTLEAKSTIAVSVYDITGKVVYKINPAEYSSGIHRLKLNLNELDKGIYLVRINNGNETKSTRISIVR